jgi:hypothetical protein
VRRFEAGDNDGLLHAGHFARILIVELLIFPPSTGERSIDA